MKNLKTKYENQFEIPSHLVWEKIEQKLDKDLKETKTITNYKSILWKVASVVILCSLIGWGIFDYQKFGVKITENKAIIPKIITEKRREETAILIKNIQKNDEILENIIKNKVIIEKITPMVLDEERGLIECMIIPDSLKMMTKMSEISDVPKEKTEYITSGDLIFSREIEKTHSEQKKSNQQKIVTNIPEPKEIEVMGIKIYQKK